MLIEPDDEELQGQVLDHHIEPETKPIPILENQQDIDFIFSPALMACSPFK